MKQEFALRPLVALILGAAVCVPGSALAITQAGVVLVASGKVKAVGADGTARELARRSPVYSGDRLVTAGGARVQVKFSDGAVVGLKPNSELRIDDYRYQAGSADSRSFMSLVQGGLRTVSGVIGKVGGGDYKVTTPVATIGIRGTLWEGDYDPGTGLDLAVWDGGIQTCNATAGCMDLGGDVDHRFGHVGPDGSMQGMNENPLGDDEEDVGGGDDDDNSVLGELENDMLDEDPDLFIPGDLPDRSNFPLRGFGVTSGSNTFGRELQSFEFARFDPVEFATTYGGLAFYESESGQYMVPGSQYRSCDGACFTYTQNYYGPIYTSVLGASTTVYWGSWYYGDMSLSATDGSPTFNGVEDNGMFVIGPYSAPSVVANMVGQTNFTLAGLGIVDGGGYGTVVTGTGDMLVDFNSGWAQASLSFTDTSNDSWNLQFDGTVHSDRVEMTAVNNAADVTSGSYYLASGASAGQEVMVQGVGEAAFVGTTTVEGVVGAFNVQAIDATTDPITTVDKVNGVFLMSGGPAP